MKLSSRSTLLAIPVLALACTRAASRDSLEAEFLQAVREAPPAATVQWLLAANRPRLAFDHLREHPVEDEELYREVADLLAQNGAHQLALEAYECALERYVWDSDSIESMSELDPKRAMAFLERIMADYPYEDETLAEIHEGYALCLHGLGRDGDASAWIGEPAEHVQAPAGCVGWCIRGDSWEWEVWKSVSPAAVEDVLFPILEGHSGAREVALQHLIDLAVARHDQEGVWSLLTLYKTAREYDAVLLAQLGSQFGDDSYWEEVEERVQEYPGHDDLALPLADYWEATGRAEEARQVLLAWMDVTLSEGGDLGSFVEESPRTRLPLLEELHAAVVASEESEGLDERLGELADAYVQLGLEERALALYRRAQELDPFDSEWWESLRVLKRKRPRLFEE